MHSYLAFFALIASTTALVVKDYPVLGGPCDATISQFECVGQQVFQCGADKKWSLQNTCKDDEYCYLLDFQCIPKTLSSVFPQPTTTKHYTTTKHHTTTDCTTEYKTVTETATKTFTETATKTVTETKNKIITRRPTETVYITKIIEEKCNIKWDDWEDCECEHDGWGKTWEKKWDNENEGYDEHHMTPRNETNYSKDEYNKYDNSKVDYNIRPKCFCKKSHPYSPLPTPPAMPV